MRFVIRVEGTVLCLKGSVLVNFLLYMEVLRGIEDTSRTAIFNCYIIKNKIKRAGTYFCEKAKEIKKKDNFIFLHVQYVI